MRLAILCFSFLFLLCSSSAFADEPQLRRILQETVGNPEERIARLQGFVDLPGGPKSARLILSYTMLRELANFDSQLAVNSSGVVDSFVECLKGTQSGTWENVLGTLGLIITYHEDGRDEALVPLAERFLAEDPSKLLRAASSQMPEIIKKEIAADMLSDQTGARMDNMLRTMLALAHKRAGREEDMKRVFSGIKDPELRESLGSGELNIPPDERHKTAKPAAPRFASSNEAEGDAPSPGIKKAEDDEKSSETTEGSQEDKPRTILAIGIVVALLLLLGFALVRLRKIKS